MLVYCGDVLLSLRKYAHNNHESCDYDLCPENCDAEHDLSLATSMVWTAANTLENAMNDDSYSQSDLRKLRHTTFQLSSIALRHISEHMGLFTLLTNATECLRLIIRDGN